jgi:uncharacterized protein involved in exopolysaccharide biosynthesis
MEETSGPRRYMEEEFDLREYIGVLIKHWKLIALATFLAAFSAGVVSLLIPPTYEATAGVVVVKSKMDITFDPKMKTLTEEDLAVAGASAAVNLETRRETFAGLVENGAIAAQVIEELGDELEEEERESARLLEMVEGEVKAKSDLIQITVAANDPLKAADIANAWAKAYERHVNAIYSGVPESYSSVQSELTEARDEYQQAEEALTAFIADNRIDEFDRLIAEKQHIINGLQSARQLAVTTVISEEVKARSQIIAAYVSAQAQNRLIAFQKEQEGKRALVSSYMDAQNRGREAVFDEQVEDRLQTLANHYATKRKMERLLEDARALRIQAQKGGEDGAATNSLAILMLKAEIFSTSTGLPGELQLQLEMASGLNAGASAQQADVEALIGVLEDRIAELEKMIEEESAALLGGEGYEFLSFSVPLTDTLSAAIREQYPELFELGELTSLTEAIPHDNPLATAALQRSEALLQLEKLETLIALTQAIDKLQEELRDLQARLEKEQATKQELTRARDLAWETYTILARKEAELGIAAQTGGTEVRLATLAVPPQYPVRPKKKQNVAIAGAMGLMLGTFGAFALNFLDPEYDSGAVIDGYVGKVGRLLGRKRPRADD